MKPNRILISTGLIFALTAGLLFSRPESKPPRSKIKKKELGVFISTYARQDSRGNWKIQLHGWVFKPASRDSTRTKLLALGLRKSLNLRKNQITEYYKERMRYFLADNERWRKLKIQLGTENLRLPGKTKANGHLVVEIKRNPAVVKKWLKGKNHGTLEYKTVSRDGRIFSGQVTFIPPKGVSVISDIDDTIKISNALEKKKLIANTFLYPFRAVPGMANIYQKWLQKGAAFHYVSGSPWQLYPDLSSFRRASGFPTGSSHMKYFRLKSRSGYKFISGKQIQHKVTQITKIIRDFPERTFILVGDSGEKDPEVYAKIAAKYPRQIRALFIRDIRGNPGAPRLKKLFKNLNKKIHVQVFTNAREISGFGF